MSWLEVIVIYTYTYKISMVSCPCVPCGQAISPEFCFNAIPACSFRVNFFNANAKCRRWHGILQRFQWLFILRKLEGNCNTAHSARQRIYTGTWERQTNLYAHESSTAPVQYSRALTPCQHGRRWKLLADPEGETMEPCPFVRQAQKSYLFLFSADSLWLKEANLTYRFPLALHCT